MTDLDLDVIEPDVARWNALAIGEALEDATAHRMAANVPVLVAEVKRLRDESERRLGNLRHDLMQESNTAAALAQQLAVSRASVDELRRKISTWRIDSRDWRLACDSLRSRLAEVERELDELHQLISKQATLLTDAVNALRGEPPELVWWSHHDIAEHARRVVAERDAAFRRVTKVEAELAELRVPDLCDECEEHPERPMCDDCLRDSSPLIDAGRQRDAALERADAAEARLEAVRELHVRDVSMDACSVCQWSWPCPTIAALDAEVTDR